MAHTYRSRNTFLEVGLDGERLQERRSQSWSDSRSTSRSSTDFSQFHPGSLHSESSELENGNGGPAAEAEQTVPEERRMQDWPIGAPDYYTDYNLSPAALHAQRKCIPCASMEVTKTCSAGDGCRFCHISHEDHKVQRPSKEIRSQCKKTLLELQKRYKDNDEERIEAIQQLLNTQSPYVRKYTVKLLGEAPVEAPTLGIQPGQVTRPTEYISSAQAASSGTLSQKPAQVLYSPPGSKGSRKGSSIGSSKGKLSSNATSLGKGKLSL